jgi:preprotein translocase subunit Sec63
MQNNWRREDVKKANRSSNRNVFIIVGILVIIAFLILK